MLMHDHPGPKEAPDVQRFWLYKRGQLVLVFSSQPGAFVPTQGAPVDGQDPQGLMRPSAFASGQFLSLEWEPRIRLLMRRADDLVELIELLEDRRYEVDLEPPSGRVRHFRFL
jgi:hypothetical protein